MTEHQSSSTPPPEPELPLIHVVAGVILKEGRVLIARRASHRRFAGKWEFPGGKVEPGEAPEQSLARILREGFGIRVRVDDFIAAQTHAGAETRINLLVYRVEYLSGTFHLESHDAIEWVKPGSLARFQLVETDVFVLPHLREGTSRSRIVRRLITLVGSLGVLLWGLHACGLIPTSRMATRSFVMSRDYADMARLFGLPRMPESFKITGVNYPGISFMPGPDGPRPPEYLATIAAPDYLKLARHLASHKRPITQMNGKYNNSGAYSVLYTFDSELANHVFEQTMELGLDPASEKKWAPDYYDLQTTLPRIQYYAPGHVFADDRTSPTIRLFIKSPLFRFDP